jgi:hypothetical protein
MSTASRFQGRFGYQPGLRVGTYPSPAPTVLQPPAPTVFPSMPAAVAPEPVAPIAPAPLAPPAAADPAPPVSAGTMPDPDTSASGPEGDGHNSAADLGPNPGTLGSLADAFGFGGMFGTGIGTGFGLSGYGALGSALGGLAGLATGVPGVGMAGAVAGSLADVADRNGMLSAAGLAPNFGLESALSSAFNNSTFGAFGKSLDAQLAETLGIPAPGTEYGLPGHHTDLPGGEQAQSKDPNAPNPDIADIDTSLTDKPTLGDVADNAPGQDKGADPANTPGSMPGSSVPGHSGVEESGSEGQGGMGSPDYGGADTSGGGYNRAGGYTGSGPDNTVQPWREAGIVHEGEIVIPAERVEQLGPEFLMMLAGPGANARNLGQTSRLAALAGLG